LYIPRSQSTEYKKRNEGLDYDCDEAEDRFAIAAAEIEAITECAVLLIEAAEMQSAPAPYGGARKEVGR
jgi:hypothetical protein